MALEVQPMTDLSGSLEGGAELEKQGRVATLTTLSNLAEEQRIPVDFG
jgi:hypothetical protein